MKKIALASFAALLAGSLIGGQVVAADASAAVNGQKIDSGLGELPHYRFWTDKSGKNPTSARIAGEKLDSGLGDIVPYSLGKNGKPPGVDVAQRK
jgi:hypothetical protein